MKPTLKTIFASLAALLISTGASSAADLHPIVEVQSGYLFGAISDGKWIKADETAKLIGDETTYRVYGLTQPLGEAKAGKPKDRRVCHVKRLWQSRCRQNQKTV